MRKTLLVLVVGLAVAAFAVAGCGGDDEGAATDTETTTETTDTGSVEAGATLLGNVGPGFVISLTTEDGEAITSLPAGRYTIEVNDQSDIHNFHLTGPGGVNTSTDVAAVEEETWDVEFEQGTYTYVCDPHASTMNGEFEVSG